MRYAWILIGTAAMAALAGCETSVKVEGEVRSISIETEPGQARVCLVAPVTREVKELGTTPLADKQVFVMTVFEEGDVSPGEKSRLFAERNTAHVIIEKEGYETYEGYLATEPGKTVAHKITLVAEPKDEE